MKEIVFLFCMFMFLSCSTSNKNHIGDIPVDSIYAEKFDNELIMLPPYSLDIYDDCLMCFQSNGDNFITFSKKDDMSTVMQWGTMGSGPEDFISPQYCGNVNGLFYIFDFNLRRLSLLQRAINNQMEIVCHKKLSKQNWFLTNLHVLNGDYILGNIVMGADNPLVLLDGDLNVISDFGSISPNKVADGKSYIGRFASSGNRFVHAMTDVGYLSCYDLIDGHVCKQWEYYVGKPVFTDDGRLNKKETLDGFWDVKIEEDKVYAIYNGKSYDEKKDPNKRFPTVLLVFSLSDGQLLKKYITDRDICRFAIDDNHSIYGVGVHPEIEIVKYKLPD